MDGLTATEEIWKLKKFKSIPIISLTAKAMKGDREKAIDAGASDYVTKPVDPDKLLSIMYIWMTKTKDPSAQLARGDQMNFRRLAKELDLNARKVLK